jgi:hypothetical protein
MKINTATNKGRYLGQGISPFPKLHAFAENESGSNKCFLPDLNGVVEISAAALLGKMQAETRAKESFFQAYPSATVE